MCIAGEIEKMEDNVCIWQNNAHTFTYNNMNAQTIQQPLEYDSRLVFHRDDDPRGEGGKHTQRIPRIG